MKRILNCLISLSLILFVVPRTITEVVATSDIIFEEDFENKNIYNKWKPISGNWGIENHNESNWLFTNSIPLKDNEIQPLNADGWTNYSFSVEIYRVSGEDINLFFRTQDGRHTGLVGHNLPIGYGLHLKDNRFALQKFTPSSGSEIGDIATIPFPSNSLKKVKVELVENNIKIFVDDNTSTVINYTDSSEPFLTGGIALAAITGASGSYA